MIERRAEARRRTRLRPGKLLSPEGRFLGDCAILDLSPRGARVRPFGSATLPTELLLFEEGRGLRWPARRAWAGASQAGLHLCGPAEDVAPGECRQIAGPFYAAS